MNRLDMVVVATVCVGLPSPSRDQRPFLRLARPFLRLARPFLHLAHPMDRKNTAFVSGMRSAFTLIEMLVVITIICVLIGVSVPAMQNMREISRRSNCQYNLAELSLAVSAYQSTVDFFPIGTQAAASPVRSIAEGYHHNWIAALLPALDLTVISQSIDEKVSVYDPKNDPARSMRIPRLLCPSASGIRENTTCYAGIHASEESAIGHQDDGVFILNRSIRPDDITDGLGYTLFFGEKISRYGDDLGWISGTRSSLRNAGHAINSEYDDVRGPVDPNKIIPPTYVGGILSDHPGGAFLLMGGGETRFATNSTDARILSQMASRSDGQTSTEGKKHPSSTGSLPAS